MGGQLAECIGTGSADSPNTVLEEFNDLRDARLYGFVEGCCK
jgi:hypothetical protein